MRVVVLLVASLAACDGGLDQRLAIVREARVLAITAEPAEAHPGESVTYTALVADPEGTLAIAPAWSYCTASKPPTEDNAVSAACLDDAANIALGTVATVTAALPSEACVTFGPDTPPGNFRPRDPDASGGYYQPIRATLPALPAAGETFGLSRITCNLKSAPPDVAHDYQLHYVANANPTLLPLDLASSVAADRDVTLTAAWPAGAAEDYLYFDPGSQTLVTRHEAMRVSWYATGGAIAVDASAIAEDDRATSVSTTWHTPESAGPATVWFVLRDSRGGIVTAARIVAIE